jgi:hypothetical protein
VRSQLSTNFKTPEELAKRLAPVPGPLYSLALARFQLGLTAERTYIDRPNVLTRHTFFAATSNGITLRDAIDIVANEVGVHLNVDDGFLARLEQGVHDTNAEAFVWAGPRVLGNTAEAFATSDGWITLAPPDVVESKRVTRPDDVSRSLREDVAAGYIVVAPPAAIRMAQGEFVGWWRIDPRSGHTLGMGGNGWGQSMVEYAATVAASFAAGFLFEYLWCAGGGAGGRPPVTADRRWSAPSTIVPSSWRRLVIVPVHAAGFDECFDLGVISGVLGAALSVFKFTWPLLLRGLGRVVPTFGGPSGAPGGGEPGPGGGTGEPAAEGGGKPGSGGGGTGGGEGETPGQPGKPQAPPAEPAKPSSPPKGSYRGDPVGRRQIEENDSIALRAMGGRDLFRGADVAADKAYNTARGLGMGDEAAHNYSRDAWNRYVVQFRPNQILTPGVPGGRLPEGDPFRQVIGEGGQVGGREMTPDVVGTDQTVAVPGAGGKGGTIQMSPPGGTGKDGTLPLAPPGSGPSETGGAPPGGRGMGGTAPLSPCAQPPCGVSPAAKTAAGIETLDSLIGNRKSGQ